jgi:uncharacterized protein (DUF1786 family)
MTTRQSASALDGEVRRILAVDIGTGTQDILLLEAGQEIENAVQLIIPSPTVLTARRVEAATAAGQSLLLTGVTMGGGPCAWAVEAHLKAGFTVFATPNAARTFDDDLEMVARMGVRVVSEDEASALDVDCTVELRDFMPEAITGALAAFGLSDQVDLYALAAFDHGAAPPGYSDRRFRFDFLRRTVGNGDDLLSFAYTRETLPAELTRLQALIGSVPADAQVVVMDTGAAAVVGALEDARVRESDDTLLVNVGNFHTLAFHLESGKVRALFEHHTGLLDRAKLDGYLGDLAAGTLLEETIFADSGHGALQLAQPKRSLSAAPPFTAVTGPRRKMLIGSATRPYFAVPHGAMMLCGCYGLLRGAAAAVGQAGEMVAAALD